jgi:hypothetical protein
MLSLLTWLATGRPYQYAQTEEVPMAKTDPGATAPATPDDIKTALGDLDQTQVLAIMSLRPTIADIEQASVWLDGDPDVFGAGSRKGVASCRNPHGMKTRRSPHAG